MKKIILFFVITTLISCSKKEENYENIKTNAAKIADSINASRTKHNDSIKILNAKNQFRDLSGNHIFTHGSFSKKGNAIFKNIGRDLYQVSGGIKMGKNFVKIEGEIKMVSEEYLNFTGKITQSISENDNGKIDIRTKKTSFAKKGNTSYWRLQNRLNNAGFTDNIDIY
jgi:hypothetical protein